MCRKIARIALLVAIAICLFPVAAAVWLIRTLAALIRQARRTERPLCSGQLSEIKRGAQIMRALEAWSSGTENLRHRKHSLIDGGLRIETSGRSVELFSELALEVSLKFSREDLDDRFRYLHGIIVVASDRSTQPTQQRLGTVSTPNEAVEVVERFLRQRCRLEELPSQVFSIECYLNEQDRRHNARSRRRGYVLEQKELLPKWREKWEKIALSCEPCDFERAKNALATGYRQAGLRPPESVILASSPLSYILIVEAMELCAQPLKQKDVIYRLVNSANVAAVECEYGSGKSKVESEDWYERWTIDTLALWFPVCIGAEETLRSRPQAEVWQRVRDSAAASLQRHVADKPVHVLSESSAPTVPRCETWADLIDTWRRRKKEINWVKYFYNREILGFGPDYFKIGETRWVYDPLSFFPLPSNDPCPFIGFYDYLLTVCGDDRLKPLHWIIDLAECCGWWAPYENLAILLDRPSEIHLDDRQRPHNPNGMAIKYGDGWGVYCWRGVCVPAYVIEHPDRITVEDIEQERNAEVRRVKIERYGFDRYLRDAKLEEVQRDDFGVLYRRDLGNDEPPLTFVKVVNATPEPDGTRKEYVLPVRSTVRTAHEAVASTFGLTVEEYHPGFES